MMRKKFRQQSGETLVEALVSLLVAVLSMGLLATSVLAATHMNKANRDADQKYEEELYRAEGMIEQEGYEAVSQTLIIDFQNLDDVETYVEVYGGDGTFISYNQMEVNEP